MYRILHGKHTTVVLSEVEFDRIYKALRQSQEAIETSMEWDKWTQQLSDRISRLLNRMNKTYGQTL